MSAACRRHMVRRAGFAPLVAELSRSAGKACTHIRITKREDRAFLVNALGYDKLKVTVLILRDTEIRNGTKVRIELR